MRLIPRALRARVTLVFTTGAAVTLALCLGLLYVAMDRELSAALDADLQARSADIGAAVLAGDTGVVGRDPLAQLYAADGTLLAGSPSLGGRRLLSAEQVLDHPRQTGQTRVVPLGSDAAPSPVRLLSRRVDSSQVLAVGVFAQPVLAARDRLLAILLIAAPLLIGLLGAAGWLVVRAALRPVDVLTREAASISSVEADRRLPTVAGDDEIARLARTLDGMLARLRVAFARERAFVDDASHELRSPIAVLRGEIELALSTLDDPTEDDSTEVRRSLLAALTESERLSRLADDLLLLARERAGSLVLRREPLDLHDLVAAEARRLESVLPLGVDISGEPVVVHGDADRLRQLLSNVLQNSAAAGATTVRVHLRREPGWAVLEMADDGPGFPAHLQDSVFERFVRGDDARTRGSAGTGLGMAIVRAVVAAHGGTIEARNGAPLGGAVVTARLPHSTEAPW